MNTLMRNYINNKIITPIIMAGGSGSRLYHYQILYPKQFLSLIGSHTLANNG